MIYKGNFLLNPFTLCNSFDVVSAKFETLFDPWMDFGITHEVANPQEKERLETFCSWELETDEVFILCRVYVNDMFKCEYVFSEYDKVTPEVKELIKSQLKEALKKDMI